VLDDGGEVLFVAAFDGADEGAEGGVFDVGFELAELFEVFDPAGAEAFGDKLGESGVAREQPAAGCDAVGLVVEPLGVHLVEVAEEVVLDELAMELCDAVDRVGADDGEVGHADFAFGAFFDDGHALYAFEVVGVVVHDLAQEAAVDFVDDFEVPWEEALEEGDGPAFEGFGEEGVVGVAEGGDGLSPGEVPGDALFVDEDAHELGDGDGGVGVVELDGVFVGEAGEVEVGLFVAADDVVDGAGDEEVLLA